MHRLGPNSGQVFEFGRQPAKDLGAAIDARVNAKHPWNTLNASKNKFGPLKDIRDYWPFISTQRWCGNWTGWRLGRDACHFLDAGYGVLAYGGYFSELPEYSYPVDIHRLPLALSSEFMFARIQRIHTQRHWAVIITTPAFFKCCGKYELKLVWLVNSV